MDWECTSVPYFFPWPSHWKALRRGTPKAPHAHWFDNLHFLVSSLELAVLTFNHFQNLRRYFMLSFAKPHNFYQVFLAQGLGVGLGMGLIYVPSISICFHYFKRRRAQAVGTASLGMHILHIY